MQIDGQCVRIWIRCSHASSCNVKIESDLSNEDERKSLRYNPSPTQLLLYAKNLRIDPIQTDDAPSNRMHSRPYSFSISTDSISPTHPNFNRNCIEEAAFLDLNTGVEFSDCVEVIMFWRERDRDAKEANVGPLCGQVRVLIVGDSGVGKTSLVNLIVKGSSIARPPQTVGCTVGVKHMTFGSPSSSSSSIKGDSERDFFIELWDVSGHDRYKDCRFLFYSQINGVIFVHDLTQRRTKSSLQKWAVEIATTGTFTAPTGNGGPGGLPVPYIVIGNKADISAKEGTRGSSGNLVDVARQWVEKQGLLPSSSSEELPLTESFPGSGGLISAAKKSRYDKEAVMKFFHLLIRRRYFSDDLPGPSNWSIPQQQRPMPRLDESIDDYDSFYKSTSVTNDPYKYNAIPPLPAQRNLTPPPTLYPQQPVLVTQDYNVLRPAYTGSLEINSARSKRSDINV